MSNWGIRKHVNWRSILLNDILYKSNFFNTIEQLSKHNIGIVGSKSYIMSNNEYTNAIKINELLSLLNINTEKLQDKKFIGGNIFAAKTELFKPLLHNDKLKNILSKEIGHMKDDVSGTYVHSMERIFGYMAEYHSQKIYGAPNYTEIIYNPKIKKHRLHLIRLYNNDCYVQENPNIYGSIIEENINTISIKWLNNINLKPQKYLKNNKYLINNYYA